MYRTLALSAAIYASLVGVGIATAQEQTVTRIINDRPYTWTMPEQGCTFIGGWEDYSAIIECPSGTLAYDPDGSDTRDAGVWYVPDYR